MPSDPGRTDNGETRSSPSRTSCAPSFRRSGDGWGRLPARWTPAIERSRSSRRSDERWNDRRRPSRRNATTCGVASIGSWPSSMQPDGRVRPHPWLHCPCNPRSRPSLGTGPIGGRRHGVSGSSADGLADRDHSRQMTSHFDGVIGRVTVPTVVHFAGDGDAAGDTAGAEPRHAPTKRATGIESDGSRPAAPHPRGASGHYRRDRSGRRGAAAPSLVT